MAAVVVVVVAVAAAVFATLFVAVVTVAVAVAAATEVLAAATVDSDQVTFCNTQARFRPIRRHMIGTISLDLNTYAWHDFNRTDTLRGRTKGQKQAIKNGT